MQNTPGCRVNNSSDPAINTDVDSYYARMCLHSIEERLHSGPPGGVPWTAEVLAYDRSYPVLMSIFLPNGEMLFDNFPLPPGTSAIKACVCLFVLVVICLYNMQSAHLSLVS